MSDTYDLSTVPGFEERSQVPAGSSLLVTGGDGDAAERSVLSVLADGLRDGEGAVLVTTEDPAEAVLDALGEHVDIDGRPLCVIDCRAATDREQEELDNGVFVYRVSSPSDLTSVGLGLTASFDRLRRSGIGRCRLGFLSLSSLLSTTGEKQLFKFSHVISSRLDSAGYLGVFTLGAAEQNSSQRILEEAFDSTVELGQTDGRVTGETDR